MNKIKVLIADDHAIVRQGVKQTLAARDRYEVVAEVDSASDILAAADQCAPRLFILDYRMPGGDVYAVAQKLKQHDSHARIIIFTGIESPMTLQHLADGSVDGLLLKHDKPEELLKAADTVLKGKKYCSSLVGTFTAPMDIKLSPRELQLLNLIVLGWPRKNIAAHLNVTVETIKTYRKALMQKLQVHNVAELIVKARSLDLLN